MRKRVPRFISLLIVPVVMVAALAISLVPLQKAANSANAGQSKPKKLREIAMERDVEVDGVGAHSEYTSFESLKDEAAAIVYGRIIDSKSFFEDRCHPIEQGENITTEYTLEVLQVLKDKTSETMPSPDKPAPALLTTPLKIARNGGVVTVNGHRASVKVKGFEFLTPGNEYVFFLFWSPDYKAYILAGGISGVVGVNYNLGLQPLASSKEIQSKLRGISLQRLIELIK